MRAFIFVDNEKAVAQMIDDLFQHTRKSMKVIDDDDDVLCYSEKKTPHPPIHSLSSSFSFSKRWSRKLQFPAGIFHCNPNILREEIDEEGIARGRFGEISNPQHYFVLSFCSWVG